MPKLTHAPRPEAAANSLNPGSSTLRFMLSRSWRLISLTAPSKLRLRASLSANVSGRFKGDEGDEGSLSGGSLIGGEAERDPGVDVGGTSAKVAREGVIVLSACDDGGAARERGWIGVIPNAARTE